jgi:cbb3-type cytochrome oxidase maturation protein
MPNWRCRIEESEEMESIYLLIPISIVLVFIIGIIFWWSVRSGQYDDLEGPAYRLLMDDRDDAQRKGEASAQQQRGEGDGAMDSKTPLE